MKQLLFLFFIFLFSITAFAQSNNLCPESGVPVLTVNSCSGPANYNVAATFTVDPATSVPTGSSCVTASRNSRDGWYVFTANATTSTIIGTVISRDLAIAIYTGSCGLMNEVTCMNALAAGGTETISLATVVGTTYYIRLIRYNSTSNNTMTGTISVMSPVSNDDCSGAITLNTPSLGGACIQTCGNTYNATSSSPNSGCNGSANSDVWYEFVATQPLHAVTVNGSVTFNPVIELLSGSCGSLNNLACADATGDGGTEVLTYSSCVPGNTYRVRVYDFGPTPPGSFEFNICITTPIIPTCPNSLGNGVVNVNSLPYSSNGRTTTGNGNEFTPLNTITCGSGTYLQGNDEVFIFTPSSSGSISITLTSASTNVGLMLYDGCPFTGQNSTCVDFSQSAAGNQFICTNVSSGTEYYLIVDRNSAGGSIPSYNISISAPASGANGATCASAIQVNSLPYSISNQNTQCKGDDYNNSSNGSCASLYESGEDMVFEYSASSAECLHITLSNTSSTQAGFMIYQNCPGSNSANCIGYAGGGNVTGNFSLPGAGTYYIVVDSWSPPTAVTFNLNITSTNSNSPNDYPCNATPLPLGLQLQGDNSCTTGLLEPAAPSCWTGGELNTVWYTVVPSGTSLNIRTFLGTLTNTQIALYRGSCSSLVQVTPTINTCNTDIITCGSNATLNSQIIITGLTSQTYYIRVDGENDLTGTFGILAVDGGAGLPFIYGQDCGSPLLLCGNTITVNDPGYSGNGNYCDFGAGSTCLTNGERSSVWYKIPIVSNGTLTFDIVPNDYPGSPSTSGTDYDFAIWETGQSGLTCGQLATTNPVRCNSDLGGVTGCYTGGNSPAVYPGFNASYENSIPVSAGEVYLLSISNYTNNNSGFTLNFTSTPDPINYTGAPSGLNWYGGTSTNWSVNANWNSCAIPNCAIDAVINPGPLNQPVVFTNQTVNNLFITAGSTLTINANVTLSVCGDFNNSGNLVAQPGSIVKFIGSGAQAVTGNLTGANAFANFTVQKTSGTLTLQCNIDISENDSLKSGLFNSNSKYIRIKKNMFNANGASTHVSPATGSTYEFNGNAAQTYTNNGSDIDFNNIIMNQSLTNTLTLGTGTNNNMNIVGILTLTNGRIVTGTKEVIVKNPANAAIVSYNINSYVEGYLRRYLSTNATGVYDFPVGHAMKGYQLARIDFTAATQIPQLVASFSTWPVVPMGPVSSECPTANYSLSPVLNHGYWTIDASANSGTGMYTMTLFNRTYTNALSGWTVMKRTPSGSGTWGLNGTCVITSTAAQTVRTGMSGFSDFGTAQTGIILPVELLKFTAKARSGGVITAWETASEINNDYFVVERSYDSRTFIPIGSVKGAGTTTEHHSYSILDKDPGSGIIYYRLKQVDYDGNMSYSDVIAVKIVGKIGEITIYPNPANSYINFEFEADYDSQMHVEIVDIMGKIVYSEEKDLKKGIMHSQIDINELPGGVYFVRIVESDDMYAGKFVKYVR